MVEKWKEIFCKKEKEKSKKIRLKNCLDKNLFEKKLVLKNFVQKYFARIKICLKNYFFDKKNEPKNFGRKTPFWINLPDFLVGFGYFQTYFQLFLTASISRFWVNDRVPSRLRIISRSGE